MEFLNLRIQISNIKDFLKIKHIKIKHIKIKHIKIEYKKKH